MSVVKARPAADVGPNPGRPLLNQPEVWAALSLAVLYIAVMSGHSYSIDGVLMYRQATSIVQNLSLSFQTPIHWGGVFTTSRYGIGLSVLYLPGVALLSIAGLHPVSPSSASYDWALFYRDVVYTISAAPVHILVTAATAYLVARLVRDLGYGSRIALLSLASFGIASPAFVYSRGDFAQPLLGLCFVVGLLGAVHYRRSGGYLAQIAMYASLLMAVLARPVEGSLLLPALLVLIGLEHRHGRWAVARHGSLLVTVATYVLAVIVTLAINWGRFGSPFNTGYTGQINWSTPVWIGVPGVLLSPARGIIWQFPLIVLAPLGFWRLRQSENQIAALVMAALVVMLFLNTALWVPWWGAWSWGSRLFVPAWPLVAVLASVGVARLRPSVRVWLVACLFAGGVLWAVPGILTDLLGGYASAYDGSTQSFALSGYPPIGAWTFLHHLRANDMADSNAIDILWFRLARNTANLSLLVPAILLPSAVALGFRAIRLASGSWQRISVSEEGGQPAQAKG